MVNDWTNFPNLQLIGERFYNTIHETAEFLSEDISEYIKQKEIENPDYYKDRKKPLTRMEFEILAVFQQSFPNTAGLFANGTYIGDTVPTFYYITVIKDKLTGYHGIFQGSTLVYAISNYFEDGMLDEEKLYEDMDKHNLKSLNNFKYYWKEKEVIKK